MGPKAQLPSAKSGRGLITLRFVLSNVLKDKKNLLFDRSAGKPFNGVTRRLAGGILIAEQAACIPGRTRPAAGIFRVAAVFLEPEGAVGAAEQIDAAGAVAVFK